MLTASTVVAPRAGARATRSAARWASGTYAPSADRRSLACLDPFLILLVVSSLAVLLSSLYSYMQEVSYEWNTPKEANDHVGYNHWAHVGTDGTPDVDP